MAAEFKHISVLREELVAGLGVKPGGHYLDVTLGGGGHTELILRQYPDVRVTGVDRDSQAIAAASERLKSFGDRFRAVRSNFGEFNPQGEKFDGIIADLGVSSVQFDQGDRGFSFRFDAPLDMRMDQQQTLTAADIVNTYEEKALANLFYEYGDERLSRQIAKKIVMKRPIQTTKELEEIVFYTYHPKARKAKIHPATRVFQALRIAVNGELDALQYLLVNAPQWLKPQGRLGIISFHSLEDRLVKNAFRQRDIWRVLTKKPMVASETEINQNPRARSAKLRFAELKEIAE
ncbi:16S rRNA (cytosine(1402)-N(4))-methyltransferase RsmH [Picosynechococcus sp. PCC 7117]|uniref:16S rRNA (cytosine(1402)-N(4))-methyltransferase RsmH n=1 Tax=Picosynechococcus sp. PCC 7117 TaxID=195498 RepID=UPI000810D0F6|nr:16S rRNA (cytosine(1402)-N(4))-methyltransferase RsmH [Picosynechococcus sp. PCC 7117]ANV87525.1 16S rRNA (cytosine(1402)-N(4))-methyltransferase [Picosynechococcus sp. PCC 7117]